MPSYKDEKTGKWYCKFYYRDWTDKNRPKKKMGFRTKKESQAWERTFLEKQQDNPDMCFGTLVEIYLEDVAHRFKESTMETKKYTINEKILPVFKSLKISDITAAHIRKWQNNLISHHDKNGNPYSETYIKTIHSQLSAIFNYAMKYYGLKSNPCRLAGSIGKDHAEEMDFWTKDEFNKFIEHIKKIEFKTAYIVLYYTGMRVGELLALTPADITPENITINKSYARIRGKDIISSPKTPKSNRTITIPNHLYTCITEYQTHLYDIKQNDRLFLLTKYSLSYHIKRICDLTGIKKIRLHDIRHSHASLLIEMGFDPLVIADRLGHEKIETTLNIYSHLYPTKRTDVAQALENI